MFFAQALLVALVLAAGDRPDPAGLEVGDGRSGASTGPPRAAHSCAGAKITWTTWRGGWFATR